MNGIVLPEHNLFELAFEILQFGLIRCRHTERRYSGNFGYNFFDIFRVDPFPAALPGLPCRRE